MLPSIPFNKPTTPSLQAISPQIEDILTTGQLTNGKYVRELERKATEFLGVPTIAVSSCTSGLILALRSLNLTGRVIVPSFTFFATTHALYWNNLKPLFVDIDPHTWNIDPEKVMEALTRDRLSSHPKISAILGVDIFGNHCDRERLSEIAKDFGVPLIVDAAHSLGGYTDHRADIEVYSLSPTKLITGGEGGLISTRRSLDPLIALRNYGDSGNYDCESIGLNARMPEISAVLALEGLRSWLSGLTNRAFLYSNYRANLSQIPGLIWQRLNIKRRDVSALKDISVVIVPKCFGMDRDELAAKLKDKGIPTRKYFYPPAHRQTAYLGSNPYNAYGRLTETNRVSDNIISLPIYSDMADDEVDLVCKAIKDSYLEGKVDQCSEKNQGSTEKKPKA